MANRTLSQVWDRLDHCGETTDQLTLTLHVTVCQNSMQTMFLSTVMCSVVKHMHLNSQAHSYFCDRSHTTINHTDRLTPMVPIYSTQQHDPAVKSARKNVTKCWAVVILKERFVTFQSLRHIK